MAFSSYGAIPKEKRREEMKKKRLEPFMKNEEVPSFTEPKMTKDDNEIADQMQMYFGEMNNVSKLIGSTPNNWLGTTSRGTHSSSCNPPRSSKNPTNRVEAGSSSGSTLSTPSFPRKDNTNRLPGHESISSAEKQGSSMVKGSNLLAKSTDDDGADSEITASVIDSVKLLYDIVTFKVPLFADKFREAVPRKKKDHVAIPHQRQQQQPEEREIGNASPASKDANPDCAVSKPSVDESGNGRWMLDFYLSQNNANKAAVTADSQFDKEPDAATPNHPSVSRIPEIVGAERDDFSYGYSNGGETAAADDDADDDDDDDKSSVKGDGSKSKTLHQQRHRSPGGSDWKWERSRPRDKKSSKRQAATSGSDRESSRGRQRNNIAAACPPTTSAPQKPPDRVSAPAKKPSSSRSDQKSNRKHSTGDAKKSKRLIARKSPKPASTPLVNPSTSDSEIQSSSSSSSSAASSSSASSSEDEAAAAEVSDSSKQHTSTAHHRRHHHHHHHHHRVSNTELVKAPSNADQHSHNRPRPDARHHHHRRDSSSSISSINSSSKQHKPNKKRAMPPSGGGGGDPAASPASSLASSTGLHTDSATTGKHNPAKKRRIAEKKEAFMPLYVMITTISSCDGGKHRKSHAERFRRKAEGNGYQSSGGSSRNSKSPAASTHTSTTTTAAHHMPVSQSTGSETEKPVRFASDVTVCPAMSSDVTSSHNLHQQQSCSSATKRQFDDDDNSNHNSGESYATYSNGAADPSGSKRVKAVNGTPSPAPAATETPTRRTNCVGNQYQRDTRRGCNERAVDGGDWSGSQQPQHQRWESDPKPPANRICTVVSEPDSSWPEQETLMKSEQYMREGKRLKHDADSSYDSRRPRQSIDLLGRGLLYFEASLAFTMYGHMLELENEKNSESGSSSANSSLSPSSMYDQTIPLFEHVRKLRISDVQQATDFRRLTISCLRAEALLHLRIFHLKQDSAVKNLEQLQEQFKQAKIAANNRTPSPWRGGGQANNQQQVVGATSSNSILSPVSPAVPSPYGNVVAPGPSPAAGSTCSSGTGEIVSSSTQMPRIMPSPSASGVMAFSPKVYDNFKSYSHIVNHLVLAHRLWEEACRKQAEDEDFFRNVEALSGELLTMHSSLLNMVTFLKAVLHQIRVKSPK